jgi:hypothetical protein
MRTFNVRPSQFKTGRRLSTGFGAPMAALPNPALAWTPGKYTLSSVQAQADNRRCVFGGTQATA